MGKFTLLIASAASPTETRRSAGRHGLASVSSGLGEGAPYAGAGRLTQGTRGVFGDEGGTLGAALDAEVGATLCGSLDAGETASEPCAESAAAAAPDGRDAHPAKAAPNSTPTNTATIGTRRRRRTLVM